MALTAAQIKTKLKPMMDFAPAILAAAEIVEAAEAAEKQVSEHYACCATMRADIDVMKGQQSALFDECVKLQQQREQEKGELASQRAAIKEKLKPAQEQLEKAEAALEATKQEHARVLAANNEELHNLTTLLEQKRSDLADFRRGIPKTY